MSVIKLPILVFIAQSALAATCADLALLHAPNTAITLAQTVEAGALPMTGPGQTPNIFKTLPAFCRVAATLTRFGHQNRSLAARGELEWQISGVGNSGWGGYISYSAMARALAHGYATASTDTGHATEVRRKMLRFHQALAPAGRTAVPVRMSRRL